MYEIHGKHDIEFMMSVCKEKIKSFLKKHFIIAISFFGTITASLFYTLGYLFIYGYYFSGNSINIYSVLEVITTHIPLNFKPILILGILFSCITTIFFLIVKLWKQNIAFSVIFLFATHCLVALIFIGFTRGKVLDFVFLMFIWVLPILILGMIRYFDIVSKKPILIISGFSYCVIFIWLLFYIGAVLGKVDTIELWMNPIQLCGLSLLFLIPSILSNCIQNERLKNPFYFVFFPITAALSIFMIIAVVEIFRINSTSYLLLGINIIFLLTNIMLLKFTKKYLEKRYGNLYFKNEVVLDKKMKKNNIFSILFGFEKNIYFIMIISIVSIVFIFLSIAYSFIIAGSMVRMSTLNVKRDFIKYTYNGKSNEIVGQILAVKDNLYYISDSDFSLSILKSGELIASNIYSSISPLMNNAEYKWVDKASLVNFEFVQFDDDPEHEIVIYKKPNLIAIDRNSAGSINVLLSLGNIESKTINKNIITTYVGSEDKTNNSLKTITYIIEGGVANVR